jgi:hypothetical protein
MWILPGLLLSTALQGCSHKPIETSPPPPVVVEVKDPPPADVLQCPARPAGIPAGLSANIPAPARKALIDLAEAYRAAVDQLERLIAWHRPAAPCRPATPAAAP